MRIYIIKITLSGTLALALSTLSLLVILTIVPMVNANSLPPVISYILNENSSESDPPNDPEFDATIVPIPLTGAYNGVSAEPENFTFEGRLTAIADFEKLVYQTDTNSKRVAFDRQFYRWDNIVRSDGNLHPYLLATGELGRIPVASVTPKLSNGSLLSCPDNPDTLAWKCISEGHVDDHIIILAQKIRDSGISPFVFTFTHEPEDEIRCRTGANSDQCMGTADDYVAAWRHIINIFRQQNTNNVDFMWITRFNIYGDSIPDGFPTADEIYPGDDYIDWIAADIYNFAFNSDWRPLSEIADEFYAWGSQRPKPLAFGEWGSREEYFNLSNDGSRKAAWFDDARIWLKTHATKIKAVMYFNHYVEGEFGQPDNFGNTGPNWRVDTTENSLGAYQLLVQDPYFIGFDTP